MQDVRLAGVARAPGIRQPVDAVLQKQERGQHGTARVHGERACGEPPTAQELQPLGGADNAMGAEVALGMRVDG